MNLQITSIEIYKLSIPLKQPFVISLGPQYDADNIIVVINTNTGIKGWGECSPYMSINGESMDTCFIVGQYLAKALKGKDPLQIEDCTKAMDRIITRNESIKSAFDMALYDIAAQHAGLPLYKFLGGKKDKLISTDMTVGLGSPEKMAAKAMEYKAAGFPSIKVKLGTTTTEDVARIKAIRAAIGHELPLRIDANQGWSVETAIATLQALKEFGIEHCEEPIARWNYMALSEVRKNSPIKIMSDESCFDEHDAERLAKLNACDYFNVKLGKSGGIFHALKIVEVAKAHNLKLQVGCFMESRLAITALVHFAYSSDLIVHYDLDTPLMLKEDPVVGGMQFIENGFVEINEAVGIGATIDKTYLTKAEKVIIE
ncbi:dipeptide epimerase [Lacibacter luteus]|uniref:Dipeptide epimerase n=1 Tax=Lacibacter luteus TaxID=2508719 RepID=A0A4Q1CIR5_9BACT|nr:dipeptide epimerase [Lacibacter luteus]RXK60469.1 dipeptide epimerase [Lacibacter luteus]